VTEASALRRRVLLLDLGYRVGGLTQVGVEGNEPPPYVMAQMGHTTPNLTLAIYVRQMDRRDGELERLKALVESRHHTHSPSLRKHRSEPSPVAARAQLQLYPVEYD